MSNPNRYGDRRHRCHCTYCEKGRLFASRRREPVDEDTDYMYDRDQESGFTEDEWVAFSTEFGSESMDAAKELFKLWGSDRVP